MKIHILDHNGIRSIYDLASKCIIAVQLTEEDFKNINNMRKEDNIYAQYSEDIFRKEEVEIFLKNVKKE